MSGSKNGLVGRDGLTEEIIISFKSSENIFKLYDQL